MGDVLLIVNPKSGVDKSKDSIIESAVRLSESRGLRLNVEYTTGPGSAKALARLASEEGSRLVMVAGGDGTIRDAADGIWGSKTALAVIPLGSGNGLARSMCIPQDPEKALRIALSDNYRTIDRGVSNSQSFYCACGVGFDAEVSYKFSLDERRGKSTYIKHALREILKYKPKKFRIRIGDDRIETEAMLIAICNCKQYGNNAYIAPLADPADGLLDVTVVHGGNFFATAVAGIDLFSGRLDKNLLVESMKAEEIVIEGESENMTHLDGEPIQMDRDINIRCEREGLKVAIPHNVHPFKPIISPFRSMMDDLIVDIKKKLKN